MSWGESRRRAEANRALSCRTLRARDARRRWGRGALGSALPVVSGGNSRGSGPFGAGRRRPACTADWAPLGCGSGAPWCCVFSTVPEALALAAAGGRRVGGTGTGTMDLRARSSEGRTGALSLRDGEAGLGPGRTQLGRSGLGGGRLWARPGYGRDRGLLNTGCTKGGVARTLGRNRGRARAGGRTDCGRSWGWVRLTRGRLGAAWVDICGQGRAGWVGCDSHATPLRGRGGSAQGRAGCRAFLAFIVFACFWGRRRCIGSSFSPLFVWY